MTSSTMARPSGWKASNFRRFGRIPSKMRERSLRLASGRAWKGLAGTDIEIAAALGLDRRNAAKRRAGEAGPFAGVCVEVYQLATANVDPYPLIAHQKALIHMVRIRDTPTDDLLTRLDELQERETEIQGRLDVKQMRYARRAEVCLKEFRERAADQAAVSEEIVAILTELEARQK